MEVIDGARIRRARLQKQFTMRDLGFLVRRSQTTIYKIEKGELKTITEDLAILIAARLEVPWENLFVLREATIAPTVSSVKVNDNQQNGQVA